MVTWGRAAGASGRAAWLVRRQHASTAPAPPAARTICLAACEVSGDQNAGHLAATIRRQAPDVRLLGIGGPAMQAAGVDVRVHTTDFGFMGVMDGLRVVPQLVGLFRQSQQLIERARPDLVVLVDSEFVTTPFAMWLKWRRVPAAFFFPPQVWLWGRWRLPAVLPLARRFISAFRAEAELYRAAGADTVYAGHPLNDLVRVHEDPAAALRAAGLDPARPLVALMPGSRRGEIRSLLGPLLGAAERLQARDPLLQFAVPLAAESLRDDVERGVRASGLRDIAVYRHDSYAILSRARVVLQCSGTATLEAALLGVPAVIVYRCRRIEYLLGRCLVHAPFMGMVNILLGTEVQPELLQDDVNPERLATEAWSLLTDEVRRRAIKARLAEVPALLGSPGSFARASSALLDLLPPLPQSDHRVLGKSAPAADAPSAIGWAGIAGARR